MMSVVRLLLLWMTCPLSTGIYATLVLLPLVLVSTSTLVPSAVRFCGRAKAPRFFVSISTSMGPYMGTRHGGIMDRTWSPCHCHIPTQDRQNSSVARLPFRPKRPEKAGKGKPVPGRDTVVMWPVAGQHPEAIFRHVSRAVVPVPCPSCIGLPDIPVQIKGVLDSRVSIIGKEERRANILAHTERHITRLAC